MLFYANRVNFMLFYANRVNFMLFYTNRVNFMLFYANRVNFMLFYANRVNFMLFYAISLCPSVDIYAHFMLCAAIDALNQQKKVHLISIELSPQIQNYNYELV